MSKGIVTNKNMEQNFSPNENFVYYLYWMSERMNIFWRRKQGQPAPYTNDPILQEFKFTNVYRCLDRSSQYLIKNVINAEGDYTPVDKFWRILLYKHFNLPSTWDLLIEGFGDITFDIPFEEITDYLVEHQNKGAKLYSNAYMLTGSFFKDPVKKAKYGIRDGAKKCEAYLAIFKQEIFENGRINEMLNSKSLEELFGHFKKVTNIADFLAMQYAIDMNYSDLFNFSEDEFVIAGPGAIRGIERTFNITGKANYTDIIKWVSDNFEKLVEEYMAKYNIGIIFNQLPNRRPSLIDFQNCFCETDKYLRGAGVQTDGKMVKGSRIKNTFNENKDRIEYDFPKKWGVKI